MTSNPLSAPAARRHLHTRSIECRGYLRDDGLWDIEARIVDTKTYDTETGRRDALAAGSPVHDMHVRLTLDDRLFIKRAEAVMVASPYGICPAAAPNLARIEGIRIKAGWLRDVKAVYGGPQGCTHILELLRPIATTAFQTIFAYREIRHRETRPGEPWKGEPPVDSCYAYAAERKTVRENGADRSAEPSGDD